MFLIHFNDNMIAKLLNYMHW